jgi:hypothetical protein
MLWCSFAKISGRQALRALLALLSSVVLWFAQLSVIGLHAFRHFSKPLADGEDVAFGVLEPGGLGAAGSEDAVLHLEAGDVVLLEDDASGLEFRDLGGDIGDAPEGGAGLRSACPRRRVHEHPGALAAFVDDASGVLLTGSKAELFFVELAGPGYIGDWNVGNDGRIFQHR